MVRGVKLVYRLMTMNDDPAPSADDIAAAALARALGHPARVRIVRMLLERGDCIGCDLVDAVGLAQSTVSEHLRILKAAGIVTGRIERPRVCYRLAPQALAPLTALLGAVAAYQPTDPERTAA